MNIGEIGIWKKDKQEPAFTGTDSVAPVKKSEETFKDYFNKTLRSINKEHRKLEDGIRITRNSIAFTLGYREEKEQVRATSVITNNLNRSVPTSNRDRMIAILIAAGFDAGQTNHALELYGMSRLREDCIKDNIILQGLDNHDDYDKICRCLNAAGSPLQIKEEKAASAAESSADIYDVLDDHIYYGDFVGNRSLEGLYDPSAMAFTEVIILKDHEGNKYTLHNDGGYCTIEYDYADGGSDVQMGLDISQCYLPGVQAMLVESNGRLVKKRRETFAILNDTRNYIIRYDIAVKNAEVQIYAESFDYDYPEQMRYFQFTRNKDTFRLTVTHNSQFLHHHLPADLYKEYYGRAPEFSPLNDYDSPDSIESKYDRKVFDRMTSSIRQLLSDIGSGKVLIADPYVDLWDDPGRNLTDVYGIKDRFNWLFDEKTGEYYPEVWECTIDMDGNPFTVTFDMLMEAYRREIHTIKELYDITTKYNSLEGFYKKQAEILLP